MAERVKLPARERAGKGKGAAKRLRGEGMLPAVVYGRKSSPLSLSIDLKHFLTLIGGGKSESKLFCLSIEGNGGPEEKTVMIKELQVDPVTRHYLHVDFFEVSMDEEVTLSIPINLTGEAVGVEMGGILQQVRRELEIKCLPSHIPDKIEIDVSNLAVGDSVHLKDVTLPQGIKLLDDVDLTIATVLSPTVEKEVAAEVEEGAVAEEAAAEEGAEEKKPAEGKKAEDAAGGGKD